jgi:uncharacterized membrane-anchored protein
MGWPINPELAVGAMVPLVLWCSWVTIRRIHQKLRPEINP